MNGKSTGMVGEMTRARVISGQFEYPQQNVSESFSFVVTYSDLPKVSSVQVQLSQLYLSSFSSQLVCFSKIPESTLMDKHNAYRNLKSNKGVQILRLIFSRA